MDEKQFQYGPATPCGAPEMALSPELREALHEHLADLKEQYQQRGWAGRVGFGQRPALIVIDLALSWTRPRASLGSDLDPVVNATVDLLEAARASSIPIFFTTGLHDPAEPKQPALKKFVYATDIDFGDEFSLDARLERRASEKLIAKPYASAFKGTHLEQMLATLGVDTVIVAGCSTSHCVYATCRDAVEHYHVIVPREAVGDRSELLHEVNLFDIDVGIGDVLATQEVVNWLRERATPEPSGR
jgi:maleamate amidohydrolase